MIITTSYSRSRFLADLTMGFADGLTVPFALTAGISSLGKTETVIYAGLAEVCAGCLSMGVGGYLSSRGELVDAQEAREAEYAPSSRSLSTTTSEEDLEQGLLSDKTVSEQTEKGATAPSDNLDTVSLEPVDEAVVTFPSPLLTGLSIAMGYVVGGLLPLIPYFFVQKVGDGLLWSTILCVMALFVFGFGKRLISTGKLKGRMRKCLWEGVQMAGLGGIAAGAAVLCVKLLRGDV